MRTKGSKNKYIKVKVLDLFRALGPDTEISLPEKFAHLFETGGIIVKDVGQKETPKKKKVDRNPLERMDTWVD